MTSLLIDIGNSYLKWAVKSEQGFVFGGRCKSRLESIDALFTGQFKALKPDNMFIACVGDKSIWLTLREKAKACWAIEAELLLSPAMGCGITNAYADHTKLGADRWAAMVAAFDVTSGPVCVVSSGTAVTVDVINRDGKHLGGYIIPGYSLMQECLQQRTQMEIVHNIMPSVQYELGQSTEACIQQGVTAAVTSFVDAVFATLQARLPGIELILTGGDAERLHNQLGCESNIDPHLVLQGLGIIYCSEQLAN